MAKTPWGRRMTFHCVPFGTVTTFYHVFFSYLKNSQYLIMQKNYLPIILTIVFLGRNMWTLDGEKHP